MLFNYNYIISYNNFNIISNKNIIISMKYNNLIIIILCHILINNEVTIKKIWDKSCTEILTKSKICIKKGLLYIKSKPHICKFYLFYHDNIFLEIKYEVFDNILNIFNN